MARITKAIKNEMLTILEQIYGDTKSALEFTTPFELLIAVILSAQCTDVRVNIITRRMFPRLSDPAKIVEIGLEKLENEIRDCGLYHSKAKNILATCEILCQRYHGQVPETFDELLELPGVGRKTANVMMSVAFGQPALAVDTHVFRVSNRLKLAIGETPEAIEEGLKRIIPREKWGQAHHWLIWHGRKVCKARKPNCQECHLNKICPNSETKG